MSGYLRDLFIRWLSDGVVVKFGWFLSFKRAYGFDRLFGVEGSKGYYGSDLWRLWFSQNLLWISCEDYPRSDCVYSMEVGICLFNFEIRYQDKETTVASPLRRLSCLWFHEGFTVLLVSLRSDLGESDDISSMRRFSREFLLHRFHVVIRMYVGNQIPDLYIFHRFDGIKFGFVRLITLIGMDWGTKWCWLIINWALWDVYFGSQFKLQGKKSTISAEIEMDPILITEDMLRVGISDSLVYPRNFLRIHIGMGALDSRSLDFNFWGSIWLYVWDVDWDGWLLRLVDRRKQSLRFSQGSDWVLSATKSRCFDLRLEELVGVLALEFGSNGLFFWLRVIRILVKKDQDLSVGVSCIWFNLISVLSLENGFGVLLLIKGSGFWFFPCDERNRWVIGHGFDVRFALCEVWRFWFCAGQGCRFQIMLVLVRHQVRRIASRDSQWFLQGLVSVKVHGGYDFGDTGSRWFWSQSWFGGKRNLANGVLVSYLNNNGDVSGLPECLWLCTVEFVTQGIAAFRKMVQRLKSSHHWLMMMETREYINWALVGFLGLWFVTPRVQLWFGMKLISLFSFGHLLVCKWRPRGLWFQILGPVWLLLNLDYGFIFDAILNHIRCNDVLASPILNFFFVTFLCWIIWINGYETFMYETMTLVILTYRGFAITSVLIEFKGHIFSMGNKILSVKRYKMEIKVLSGCGLRERFLYKIKKQWTHKEPQFVFQRMEKADLSGEQPLQSRVHL